MTSNRRSKPDYELAYREALRLLTPSRERGGFQGNTDEWRLARAQWHYDHGSKALAERELRDINALRTAYDHERPGEYPPMELRR